MPPDTSASVRELWLIAGPNGSGKSTLAGELPALSGVFASDAVINPDQIARARRDRWERAVPLLRLAWPRFVIQKLLDLLAIREVDALVARRVREGQSVAVETVLSTTKHLDTLAAAREREFIVGMVFVTLRTPEMNIDRVRGRVGAGGHGVPEAKIRKRWGDAHQNLGVFAPRLDFLLVYGNSGEQPVLLAEKTELGARVVLHDRSYPSVTEALSPFE